MSVKWGLSRRIGGKLGLKHMLQISLKSCVGKIMFHSINSRILKMLLEGDWSKSKWSEYTRMQHTEFSKTKLTMWFYLQNISRTNTGNKPKDWKNVHVFIFFCDYMYIINPLYGMVAFN